MNKAMLGQLNERGSEQKNAPEVVKDEQLVDFGALFAALWNGKWIIAGVVVISTMIGAYYAYAVAVPYYRSTAVIMLKTQQDQVVNLESVVSGLSSESSAVNSEVQVLRSRGLLGNVVDQLNLTQDPEFNPSLRTPTSVQSFKTSVKALLRGLLGGHDQQAPVPGDADRAKRTRELAINILLGKLTTHNIPQTVVFEITVQTTSGEKSAKIADTLSQLYIEDQLTAKFDATEQATRWLTQRVSDLQAQLEAAEAKVAEFSASTDLVSQDALTAMERQLKSLRDRLEGTKAALQTSEQYADALTSASTVQEKLDASGQAAQLQPLLSDGQETPAFDNAYDDLLQRELTNQQRLRNQVNALATSEVELKKQTESQGADLITLQQLDREAAATKLLYEYFLSRLKETSAQRGIQQADSRVLSPSVVSGAPAEPRKSMIMMMSAVLGFVLGAGLILVREAANNTFMSARDMEGSTGYPVMGQIPMLRLRRRADIISYLADKPASAAAEAIRNLRTSLLLTNIDSTPQVILCTSSFPGEGKTTIAIAMAQNLAAMGKRVLLVEGDIRRRIFSQYFTDIAEDAPGLLAVLTGDVDLEDAVLHEGRLGSDILLGEKTEANAADLFSSTRFSNFLEIARTKYDHVIIDTPPVLIVPDARVIAQHVDASLFIVKWNQTTKTQVQEALSMFTSVNQPVSGLVLNQVGTRGAGRYGYGYGYGYGSYAKYGRDYYTK